MLNMGGVVVRAFPPAQCTTCFGLNSIKSCWINKID